MNGKLWPITLAISIVGFIGNTISIVVWTSMRSRQRMRKTHTGVISYFILLPLVDNCVLLMYIATETLVVAIPELQTRKAYAYFYCYVGHPLFFFAVYTSGFLVVSLTLQRVQVVLSPMKKLKINLVLQTRILIFLAFFVSFLLNVTSFFAYEPKEVSPFNNGTDSVQQINNNTVQKLYSITKRSMKHKELMFTIRCVFATGFPCIIIFLANIAICKKQKSVSKKPIRTCTKRAARNGSNCSSDKSIFQTLLLITCSTFLFWLLRCINGCMQYIIHTDNVVDNIHVALQNFGITIGASLNLLIYYLPGKSFRTQLRRVLTNRPLRSSSFLSPITSSSRLLRNSSYLPRKFDGHSCVDSVHHSNSNIYNASNL